jgi:hypothetical protein
MFRFAVFAALLLLFAGSALAQTAIPDLRGTWKGESETIVLGGNPHHGQVQSQQPRLSSVPFTLTVDQQEGRRFHGIFASARANEAFVAVISRTGAIYLVDDDGYSIGALLAPNRLELCYLHLTAASRIASCTEFLKQP